MVFLSFPDSEPLKPSGSLEEQDCLLLSAVSPLTVLVSLDMGSHYIHQASLTMLLLASPVLELRGCTLAIGHTQVYGVEGPYMVGWGGGCRILLCFKSPSPGLGIPLISALKRQMWVDV